MNHSCENCKHSCLASVVRNQVVVEGSCEYLFPPLKKMNDDSPDCIFWESKKEANCEEVAVLAANLFFGFRG